MPQVDRQLGQQLLHIGPLPIPGRQPMDGEGVAQVVQPRLVASAGPPDAGLLTHTQEAFVDGVLIQPRARAHREEGSLCCGIRQCRLAADVPGQGIPQLRAQRDQSSLGELGVAHLD